MAYICIGDVGEGGEVHTTRTWLGAIVQLILATQHLGVCGLICTLSMWFDWFAR